jgi:hypothetical protein
MDPVILASARKQGVADDEMLHALGGDPEAAPYDLVVGTVPIRQLHSTKNRTSIPV